MQGELAHRHQGTGILGFGGDIPERLQLAGIVQGPRGIDEERQREVRETGLLQQAQGTNRQPVFEALPLGTLQGRGGPQRKARLPELRPRHLPVIGDGLRRRLLEEPPRLVRPTQSLGGATLPVGAARQGVRALGQRRDLREMPRRPLGIVEEAQGDPARVELGLDLLFRGAGAVAAHHRVGGLGIARIEQLAGDDAALDPPFIAIDQHVRVGRGVASTAAASTGLSARRKNCAFEKM